MNNEGQTTIDYKRRITRVLIYINEHLAENVELSKIAAVSCFSPFHFHRIFKALTGETVFEYIARLRLETAARMLRYTHEPVNSIAWQVGYETHSSLTKAFRKQFGVSPSKFRMLNSPIRDSIISINPLKSKMMKLEKPEMIVREEKDCLFVEHIGAYNTANCGNVWQTLWKYVVENNLCNQQTEVIGLALDDPDITKPENCRYDACITVDKPMKTTGEIGCKKIPGGLFVKFTYKGPYTKLSDFYQSVYGEWLPKSGQRLRDCPCIEKYVNDPQTTPPEELITELWLPIE